MSIKLVVYYCNFLLPKKVEEVDECKKSFLRKYTVNCGSIKLDDFNYDPDITFNDIKADLISKLPSDCVKDNLIYYLTKYRTQHKEGLVVCPMTQVPPPCTKVVSNKSFTLKETIDNVPSHLGEMDEYFDLILRDDIAVLIASSDDKNSYSTYNIWTNDVLDK